jgi:hypothetical protein
MQTDRKEVKKGIVYWLRWFAVLPGSILAAVISIFPLHWILYSSLSQIIEPYPETPERFIMPLVIAIVFIWIGSLIAPEFKFETAIVLLSIWVFVMGGFVFIVLLGGTILGKGYKFEFGMASPIVAILGAFIGLFIVRKSVHISNKT